MPEPTTRVSEFMAACRARVDDYLSQQLAAVVTPSVRLRDAMSYSVVGGGKRIRPALCLAAAEALGQSPDRALVPACSLELIHAYSLIHDDLPAMDNDELRRGRATTHIAFDEATAILAGDALQAMAFEWLAQAPGLSTGVQLAMIRELARASGAGGMVGGQAVDLESVGQALAIAQLETMHRHKTGALIEASVRLGALTCESIDDRQLTSLGQFAKALGLAFQVQDDLLDIEGETEVIGKPRGSDLARNKPTYPALLGTEGARQHLSDLLAAALASLDGFGEEAETLRAMAGFVVARSH